MREREREKEVNTWVSGNLRSGKGFVWVTIAIGSGAGIVIDWDNWGGNKRCFVHFRIQVRGLSHRREGKCGLLCLCQLHSPEEVDRHMTHVKF